MFTPSKRTQVHRDKLQVEMENIFSQDVIIVQEDFNARVGNKKEEK